MTDFLGYSPYHEDAVWGAEEARIVPSATRGAYRFLHLKPRDAIVAALDEQAGDLSLAALEERLKSGGLDLGKRADQRRPDAARRRETDQPRDLPPPRGSPQARCLRFIEGEHRHGTHFVTLNQRQEM